MLPFLLVATVGLAVTSHTAHTGSALVDLWIGAAFLVGCTVGLPSPPVSVGWSSSWRLLQLVLAVLGILQYHGLIQLFQYGAGGDTERLKSDVACRGHR